MINKAIFIIGTAAFLLCYCLLPVLERIARDKGFLTNYSSQKKDKRRVPYVGGTGMFLAFLIVSLSAYLIFPLQINPQDFYAFLISASIIVLFGLYDDVKELKPAYKLIGQFIAAAFIVGFGIRTQIIYVNNFINILISMLWIIIMVNAFNLLDILDGLAGGISLINIFVFLLFGLITNNHFVILVAVGLLGVLFAFLRYNLPPARIFMGDTGSQFLGFAQAILAISLSLAKGGREIGLVIPLVVLAIPLFDLFFVIFMRIRQRKSIFLKSNDHFVFKMLQFGISSKMILRIMIVLSILTNSCALIIFLGSNITGAIVFLLLISVLFLFGARLSRLEMNQ